ncbi:neurofilament heavy polypeptide-like [Salvia splendens]|uniref:neurofilament heavy polypeptide-like n=1 Tax=Salvia splendens TaxID=180675 RepID=UPI001C25E817|nr:neurofilament heavy polypeptide-like [Salvia splendens]
MAEEMEIPTGREVEDADVNMEEQGVKRIVTIEAGQPLLTAEEVLEKDTTVNEEENPTERVETSPAEGIATSTTAPERREVVIVTDEEEESEKRRPAREETSGKRSEEEQPKEALRQRAGEDVDSPARSAVGVPRRRTRLIIDEEPEEEEDVIFTPIDAQPSSGLPESPAKVEDSEREKREQKRKGKSIAILVKKKPRQASSTLVIRERRQEAEERDLEEDEALRFELRSKRMNDGTRSASAQRPEIAGV